MNPAHPGWKPPSSLKVLFVGLRNTTINGAMMSAIDSHAKTLKLSSGIIRVSIRASLFNGDG